MYVDETGGTEETVTSEEMTVTVDGTEYAAELNADLDQDGTSDASVIDNADGTKSVFVDTDGDHAADQYAELSSTGEVVAEARFDESSGEWVALDPSAPSGPPESGTPESTPTDTPTTDDSSTAGGGVMTAELPSGEVEVGPPTLDTNEDGVQDTSVAEDADGNTFYFTDVDNDGEADFVVVVGADGTTQALEHQGGGEWTQVEGASAPPSAPPSGVAETASSGFAGSSTVEGVAKIDALSGQWISPN